MARLLLFIFSSTVDFIIFISPLFFLFIKSHRTVSANVSRGGIPAKMRRVQVQQTKTAQ